jgi:aminoglycoside 6'-N-acetyltransferase
MIGFCTTIPLTTIFFPVTHPHLRRFKKTTSFSFSLDRVMMHSERRALMASKREIGAVELEPFDPGRHRTLLERWLREPHVARWWGEPERTLEELTARPEGGGEALITCGGRPLGYLRWQVPSNEELEAAGLLGDVPADTIDIDIAIGEPELVGRGIGSTALHLLAERLKGEGRARMLMLCTSTMNLQAVRAFDRAGFERVRTFQDPEHGEMWLMMRGIR